MSGAHADIGAVFDYSPDAKLLAKNQEEEAEYEGSGNGDEERRDVVEHPSRAWTTGTVNDDGDLELGKGDDNSALMTSPTNSPTQERSEGILLPTPTSPQPQRRKPSTSSTHAHFGRGAPPRRASFSQGESSPLKRLYSVGEHQTSVLHEGGGGGGLSVPVWAKELQTVLRGMEERQKRMEEALGSR